MGRAAAARQQLRSRLRTEFGRLSLSSGAVLLLALAFACVPAIARIKPTLDSSWANGLNEAIDRGLQFGSAIQFTYGPWAELDSISPLSLRLLAPGLILYALVAAALIFLAWHFASMWLSPFVASVIVLSTVVPAVSVLQSFSGIALLLAVLSGLALVVGRVGRRWSLALLAINSVLAGVALEVKFSDGILAIAVVGLATVLEPSQSVPRRFTRLGIVIAAFVVAVATAWVAAGQSPVHFLAWVHGSLELTSGYADAMATEQPPGAAQYIIFVILTLALLYCLWRARESRMQTAWPGLLLGLFVSYAALRAGFTRHDLGHSAQSFLILLVAIVAVASIRRAPVSIIAMAVACASVFGSIQISYFSALDPGQLAARAINDGSALISANARASITITAFNSIRKTDNLPQSISNALTGRTVDIDPYEANIAFAYGMTWAPVPVLQTYSAYTPYLDQLNAKVIASKSGPSAVLRHAGVVVDNRNPVWESPAYMVALMCNFRSSAESGDWMALIRTAPRCDGAKVGLGSKSYIANAKVSVPRAPGPGYIVVASIAPKFSITSDLVRLIFKPRMPLTIAVQGDSFRLAAGSSRGPLVLRVPSRLGWGSKFGGAVDYDYIQPSVAGTVTFSAIPIH